MIVSEEEQEDAATDPEERDNVITTVNNDSENPEKAIDDELALTKSYTEGEVCVVLVLTIIEYLLFGRSQVITMHH